MTFASYLTGFFIGKKLNLSESKLQSFKNRKLYIIEKIKMINIWSAFVPGKLVPSTGIPIRKFKMHKELASIVADIKTMTTLLCV